MKVLYVSKASRLAAHRDKLAVMGRSVDLILVVPRRWGRQGQEPVLPTDPHTVVLPALFHGHNHLHVYRGLAALLDAERPDLVHADEEPYSAVTAQVAALCARRTIPFVFFAWQNLAKRLPPPFGVFRSAVFTRAAGGIGGTERAAAVLRHAGFKGPLAVIPQMGVDPERFRPDPIARALVRERLGIAEGTVRARLCGEARPGEGRRPLSCRGAGYTVWRWSWWVAARMRPGFGGFRGNSASPTAPIWSDPCRPRPFLRGSRPRRPGSPVTDDPWLERAIWPSPGGGDGVWSGGGGLRFGRDRSRDR